MEVQRCYATSLLVSLVLLIDRLPWPSAPVKRPRGRPKTYSDRLILKALVIMIIRRLYTAYALLTFLDQDDAVAQQLRLLLYEQGRFPTRRTWERRSPLPPVAWLDRLLWAASGRRAHAVGPPRTRRRGGQHALENEWRRLAQEAQGSRRDSPYVD